MADWIGNIKGLAGGIIGLFSNKRKLSSISADEIRQERIRLEQTEMKLLSEIEGIEGEKKELFAKGAQENSQRMQLVLARKIKELDALAKGRDKQLAIISRQSRVLSGLSVLKENDSVLREMGISNLVGSMDLVDLERFIERASVQGEFQMEKLGQILEVVEGGDDIAYGQDEDEDTLAIIAAMQEAKTEQESGNADAIEQGIKSTQDVLDKPHDNEGEQI
jgi:hypothetical protein